MIRRSRIGASATGCFSRRGTLARRFTRCSRTKDISPKELLWTLRKMGSPLQGHPQIGLAGVEISSGSLGQGLSIANGIAMAANLDAPKTRTYCLMGDGETNEGQVWEAAMTSAHYKLDNVCAIIDFNKLQIDGFCCEVNGPGIVQA